MLRRSPINPVSDKRRADRLQRAHVRLQVFRRDNHTCQAHLRGVPGLCVPTLDAHEIIPRSAWREGWLIETNIITVCRAHHDWIGANPDRAHELGLHGYSWERPDHQPLEPNR